MVELTIKKLLLPVLTAILVATRLLSARKNSEDTNEEKPIFGSGKMFDKFAAYYDVGNRFMSLGQDQRWRKALLREAGVSKDDSVLDLATGSADVAIAARTIFDAKQVVGLDPSVEMLKVGQSKIDSLNVTGITLVEGDAQNMHQFKSGQFDKITMSFGIRNVPDRIKALIEMRRVIASNERSRLAIMEFSAPPENSILGKAAQLFVRHVVPLIGGLITSATDEYRYLEESIFQFPQPSECESMIENAGFEMIRTTSYAAGVVNIYIAKPRL
jgi:demethylmenaquinone methyltransferase/2-methoxy-6-polyprenyl-1,4-benzoquinol methylase